MITILVVDDENRVYRLLAQVLAKEGYSIFSEPEARGAVKIVKKEDSCSGVLANNGILDLTEIFLKSQSGNIYQSLLDKVEKPLIEHILRKTEGNKLKAAKMLGINRNTLNSKIKKLGINSEVYK